MAKANAPKCAPHEAFLETELYVAADARRYMLNSYRTRPHDDGFRVLFSETLTRMMADQPSDAPGVLVHCAQRQGSDRDALCADSGTSGGL